MSDFVRTYGLMPSLLEEVGYKGVAKMIFLDKLSAIHNAVLDVQKEIAEKKADGGSEDLITLEGDDNG